MAYGAAPPGDLTEAVQRITLSSDTDYVLSLIPLINEVRQSSRADELLGTLNHVSAQKEAEIERICNSNHQEFVGSVQQLLSVRQGTMKLTAEILDLNQSIQSSTEKLSQQKKALVDSRSVRENIDEATKGLDDCLEVLRLANQVHDLLNKKRHYAALQALDELRNVHLREIARYKLAEMIEKSVPATQRLIAEAVMTDLNTWLYRIREASQYLGEVAFYHTSSRRERLRKRGLENNQLGKFKLNSAIELVADETDEFDVLNNEETDMQVDFSPLFECMHIHETLGRWDYFKQEYAATRRRQKELIIPTSLNLQDEEEADLSSLLESIAGFAIVERATMKKTDNLRASVDVDELWDSMCQSAVALITNALHGVDDDVKLVKIKGHISLFIQTMDSWNYSTTSLHSLVLAIFDKYSELLKQRFSVEFEQIVANDDYMAMGIKSREEYDKVLDVAFYTPQEDASKISFPCMLPFSQMYPLCCIDIRNFLNQVYSFSDELFDGTSIIDNTLQKNLDELLCNQVCETLIKSLRSQNMSQITQILRNFEHFENACEELQTLLFEARSSTSAGGPVSLKALDAFGAGKKVAEKRIFELVNSKIDDLIETAEYDWSSMTPQPSANMYVMELTRYISVSMEQVLVALPTEIKELIYFDALSHASNAIMQLPLDPSVRKITPAAIKTLAQDVQFLSDFVDSLKNPILRENMDELVQTVALMQSSNPEEEFFDRSVANKKYGRVDRANGAFLLEKVREGALAAANPTTNLKNDAFSGLMGAGRYFQRG